MCSLKVTMVTIMITMHMVTILLRVVSYCEETYQTNGHKTRQVPDVP